MDSAVASRPGLNSAALNSGAVVKRAPPVPLLIASTAMTTKAAMNSSSASRKMRFTTAVKEMPT